MPCTDQEQANLRVVRNALAAAATDFSKLVCADDIAWTITSYGLVARTFRGVDNLTGRAEKALTEHPAQACFL